MRPAVFLDRDGVLNRLVLADGRHVAPRTLGEFSLLPGAGRALQALRCAGFVVIVVTNQPEIARGRLLQADLELMHLRLLSLLPVHAVYTCPHDDSDFCHCRKPLPGLLFRAARDWSIALHLSFMVGDSWRDIVAGRAAGGQTILVTSGDLLSSFFQSDFSVPDVSAAVGLILNGTNNRSARPDETATPPWKPAWSHPAAGRSPR